MKALNTMALAVICASCLGILACDDDAPPANPGDQDAEPEPNPEPEPEPAPEPEPEPEACDDNADCRGGEVCRQGRCLQFCAQDSPCTVGFCLLDQNTCVECLERDHCTPGLRCDAASHRCVEAECVEDIDCQGGFGCVDGTCVSLVDPFCQPDERTCQDNTLLTCAPDGASQTSTPCAEAERCVQSDEGAACLPLICTPFEVGCIDDRSAFSCDETGTRSDTLPCRQDQSCVEGVCTPQVCTPNQVACQDGALTTCDALGLSAQTIVCDETPECLDNPLGCACAEAACRLRVCEPDRLRCVDGAVESCSPDGLEIISEPCGPDSLCLDGACHPLICEPDATRCRGDRLATCNDLGTAEIERDCQASGAFCDDAGPQPRCAPHFCQPDQPTCLGGRAGICNERGSALAPGSTNCASLGQICRLGQCSDECEPGERFCQNEVAFECQDDRRTLTQTPCGQGAFCDAGICQPDVCTPQEPTCEGQIAGLCDERGSGVGEGGRDCALEGLSCDEGACVACEPGQARCAEDDRVEVCEGGSWQLEPRSHQGCRFWSIDLDNFDGGLLAPHGVSLINADASPSQIAVERGNGQPLQITPWPTQIAPRGLGVLEFNATFVDLNTNTALLDTSYVAGTMLGDQSFFIQTSSPASATQLNPLRGGTFTTDGSLLFPQGAAGTEFIVLSWQHRSQQFTIRGFITIVAVDDDPTIVSVTPTARIIAGTDRVNTRSVAAIDVGELRTFTLERGQFLNLETEGPEGADLTGSVVTSNRPVLVFSGHECANIPLGVNFCDHLEEMMPSVDTWGSQHVISQLALRGDQPDLFQIVASQDLTEVQLLPPQAGIDTLTLARGQKLTFQSNQGFQVLSSAPVLVGHYITGGGDRSDPSMMVVPSLDAWLTRNDIFMPDDFPSSFTSVVTRAGNEVLFDLEPIEDWEPIHDSGFVAAQIPTDPGAHTLTSDEPFWSSVYGYSSSESFLLVGGRGL